MVSVVPMTMNLLRFDFEAKRRITKTIKTPHPVNVPTKKKKEKTTAVSASFKYEGRIPGTLQAAIRASTAIKLKRMCDIKKEALRGSESGYFTRAYTTQIRADIPTEIKKTLQISDVSFLESGERFCRKSGARTNGRSVFTSCNTEEFPPPRKSPKRIKAQTTSKQR